MAGSVPKCHGTRTVRGEYPVWIFLCKYPFSMMTKKGNDQSLYWESQSRPTWVSARGGGSTWPSLRRVRPDIMALVLEWFFSLGKIRRKFCSLKFPSCTTVPLIFWALDDVLHDSTTWDLVDSLLPDPAQQLHPAPGGEFTRENKYTTTAPPCGSNPN